MPSQWKFACVDTISDFGAFLQATGRYNENTIVRYVDFVRSRAGHKRCFAGLLASFCFSFRQRGTGEEAEQNEQQNETNTKHNV